MTHFEKNCGLGARVCRQGQSAELLVTPRNFLQTRVGRFIAETGQIFIETNRERNSSEPACQFIYPSNWHDRVSHEVATLLPCYIVCVARRGCGIFVFWSGPVMERSPVQTTNSIWSLIGTHSSPIGRHCTAFMRSSFQLGTARKIDLHKGVISRH